MLVLVSVALGDGLFDAVLTITKVLASLLKLSNEFLYYGALIGVRPLHACFLAPLCVRVRGLQHLQHHSRFLSFGRMSKNQMFQAKKSLFPTNVISPEDGGCVQQRGQPRVLGGLFMPDSLETPPRAISVASLVCRLTLMRPSC